MGLFLLCKGKNGVPRHSLPLRITQTDVLGVQRSPVDVRPTYLSIPGTDKGGKRQVFSLVIAEMFSRDRAIEARRKVQGNVVAVLFLLYQQSSCEMSATKDTKRIINLACRTLTKPSVVSYCDESSTEMSILMAFLLFFPLTWKSGNGLWLVNQSLVLTLSGDDGEEMNGLHGKRGVFQSCKAYCGRQVILTHPPLLFTPPMSFWYSTPCACHSPSEAEPLTGGNTVLRISLPTASERGTGR